jgi:fluoride exporter
LSEVLFLALAGALGTLSRYGLSGLVQRISNDFPFGTLAVNVLGSLLIGFIMQIGLSTDLVPRSLRIIITIGFLGAFTTFSTFSYETIKYIEDSSWLLAALNIIANVTLSILAAFLGIILGRLTFGGAG